ncbi:hypothetical protein DB30_03387 [Enhygromyxa salina]|uniref:Lipocalin-like domain-containing protein n=1 Tax=Enhygromyxa salina TaxID=215803 RepID=A0A0C2D6Q8_9BACT|nr:lipocalin-like domain-containing protein [Enhygromyxa salina]KIG17330.1 hypothetical protein DB30_03387 [Enhygromyxa salina]
MNDDINGMHPIIGTWRLETFEGIGRSGERQLPLGPNPVAMLVYDAAGHVCGQGMRSDRPRFATDSPGAGTPEEIRAAFVGYMGYFGSYTLDDERGVVVHTLEGSLFPNWIGTQQSREFEIVDDRLTLRSPPVTIGDDRFLVVAVWRRIGGIHRL